MASVVYHAFKTDFRKSGKDETLPFCITPNSGTANKSATLFMRTMWPNSFWFIYKRHAHMSLLNIGTGERVRFWIWPVPCFTAMDKEPNIEFCGHPGRHPRQVPVLYRKPTPRT